MTNIRGAVDQPSGVFRRLLVGFDGSSESRRALRIARSLAADVGGEVHVLSVVSSRPHAGTSQARLAALDEERMRLEGQTMSGLGYAVRRLKRVFFARTKE